MASDVYCDDEDLYTLGGLPRGLLTSPGRQVATVYTATDILELDGHGFGTTTRTPVIFRAESGGSLPAEITAGTTYYAERLTDSTFQIYAASTGGSAINLSTAGSLVFVSTSLPSLEVREFYSRWVDTFMPHVVPLESPYPVLVKGIVAMLAAAKLLWLSGQKSIAMGEIEMQAKAQIERFARGVPVRDALATASSNMAVTGSVTTGGRGWTPALVGGVEVIP